MENPDKIVAVGFLTRRDMQALGEGFNRHFPLPRDGDDFTELLEQLDEVTRNAAKSDE